MGTAAPNMSVCLDEYNAPRCSAVQQHTGRAYPKYRTITSCRLSSFADGSPEVSLSMLPLEYQPVAFVNMKVLAFINQHLRRWTVCVFGAV
jgi:hypothetical protein